MLLEIEVVTTVAEEDTVVDIAEDKTGEAKEVVEVMVEVVQTGEGITQEVLA